MSYSENDQPQKFFSPLKENRRSGLLFSFTISPRGLGDADFISKIYS